MEITAKAGNQLEITEIRKSRTPRRPVSSLGSGSLTRNCVHTVSHKPRSTDRSKSGWKRDARATKNTGRGLSAYHIKSVCVSVVSTSLLTAFAFSSVSGWDWVEEHERILFFPADMAAAGCRLSTLAIGDTNLPPSCNLTSTKITARYRAGNQLTSTTEGHLLRNMEQSTTPRRASRAVTKQ